MRIFLVNFLFLSFSQIFLITSCNTIQVKYLEENSDGYTFLKKPTDRINHRELFFGREYDQISKRRGEKRLKNEIPKKLVGLAFSGGGIRSNAFHLGFISAFSEENLKKIDYISSVSGGSWAAGNFKVMKNSKYDFELLDNYIKKQGQTNSYLIPQNIKSEYHNVEKYLNNTYDNVLKDIVLSTWGKICIPFMELEVGGFIREKWRKMILDNYLQDRDISLSKLEENHKNKPFLILNSAHSAFRLSGWAKPFEFTSYSFGTLKNDENEYGGFFLNPEKNLKRGAFNLSHAMASSSAVVPDPSIKFSIFNWRIEMFDFAGLEWYFYPREDGGSKGTYKNLQKEYILTDGGHFENLGVLPLIERKLDLIISTDVSEDEDFKLDNLNSLKELSQKLLDRTVEFNNEKEMKRKNIDMINGQYGTSDGAEGKLVYIKSTFYKTSGPVKKLSCNNETEADFIDFKEFILNYQCGDFSYIYSYLNLNVNNKFPNDPTFSKVYDKQLIFAYYMLGKFYGKRAEKIIYNFRK